MNKSIILGLLSILAAGVLLAGCGNTNYRTTNVHILSHNITGSQNETNSTDVETEGDKPIPWGGIAIGVGILIGIAFVMGGSSAEEAMYRELGGQ